MGRGKQNDYMLMAAAACFLYRGRSERVARSLVFEGYKRPRVPTLVLTLFRADRSMLKSRNQLNALDLTCDLFFGRSSKNFAYIYICRCLHYRQTSNNSYSHPLHLIIAHTNATHVRRGKPATSSSVNDHSFIIYIQRPVRKHHQNMCVPCSRRRCFNFWLREKKNFPSQDVILVVFMDPLLRCRHDRLLRQCLQALGLLETMRRTGVPRNVVSCSCFLRGPLP